MFPGVTNNVGSLITPTVSLNTSNNTFSTQINTCYANLRYNSNGTEYENSAATSDNFSTSRGAWVDSGDAAAAWLERTINSGSLWVDPGSGRLNMGTTRDFKVRDTDSTSGGAQSCNMDIEMWDAVSGGSTLDSVAGLVISASYFIICPSCCFPPETLVLMGDGTHKQIGDVKAGEIIQLQNCQERVGEVIVRENRPMVRLKFADGRELILSEDHPIYVKGKGHCCVNPEVDYKNHGIAGQLEIGDHALTESGLLISLTGIERYDYPGRVYTFSNSRFFAGGIMVY